MKLPDDEFDALKARIVDVDDTKRVKGIIETLWNFVRHKSPSVLGQLKWAIELDAETLTLSILSCMSMFTDEYAHAVFSASTKVLGIVLNARSHSIDIRIAREHAEHEHVRTPYEAPAHKKRQLIAIDFEAATSRDDCTLIETLVDAVYNAVPRVPARMSFWFEPIDDALGYSLCFSHVPELPASFMEHLSARHAASVASSYMWFTPPKRVSDAPLFVVNIRSASTPVATTKARIKAATPEGLSADEPPTKRARA